MYKHFYIKDNIFLQDRSIFSKKPSYTIFNLKSNYYRAVFSSIYMFFFVYFEVERALFTNRKGDPSTVREKLEFSEDKDLL
ncbi:hypothetical protein RHABOEDO_000164 [Candidatus Rhabdochlamydia oedothoracis]|uniref:Uncharacterized protein n=1 Tax=Candidatus Rhabdochlamydia oedothoracis TaxID=2720720 RepID=A0ABX8UYY4_9BACT|nr:hypothetical protein RHOW815_001019 [Candidatus Rhabdochlamydia sp. W815]QYF48071.1 hypothetical protein RHABOEDO_000164 [Candidatus Rhabdochlamydia oedothoracis]